MLRIQLASHLDGEHRAHAAVEHAESFVSNRTDELADGIAHDRDLIDERLFATIMTPCMLDREREAPRATLTTPSPDVEPTGLPLVATKRSHSSWLHHGR